MDKRKTHRKNSWDSKVSSVSTISNQNHFRRPPSSILSSDSDIRFTRKKLTSQTRCGCFIIATFLLLLLLAAIVLYATYTYLIPQPPPEQNYRATLQVTNGANFTSDLSNTASPTYLNLSRNLTTRLNLLFRRSPFLHGYQSSEILALDGSTEKRGLVIHFNIKIDPAWSTLEASDLTSILEAEVRLGVDSPIFGDLQIDGASIEVKRVDLIVNETTASLSEVSTVTQAPAEPRTCQPLKLTYCQKIGYNLTGYPNLIGHESFEAVKLDVITFRELVDGECYRHAYDFICQILQPKCTSQADDGIELLAPCRSFCRDFMAGCGGRLSESVKQLVDCGKFPERDCAPKPGCVEELQARALSPRVCDGVVDCQDMSDEKQCSYCPKGFLHCGLGRSCIEKQKRCDGRKDCPDGSDERNCLSLTPSLEELKKSPLSTPHLIRYNSEGFVTFNEKSEIGKVCTETLTAHLGSINKTAATLHTVASSLCKSLTYQNVNSVQVETDFEPYTAYVSMPDPLAPEITFIRSLCPSRQVLKVACSDLSCGKQVTHSSGGFTTLAKMSVHGDWPWHVALYKEEVHICDGTLIGPDWLITTTSCFQGQPRAEWRARFGVVRLNGATPWEQERRIVGMVKSPVEGSTVAMVRLDEAVVFNDFVRPLCLPDPSQGLDNKQLECNTLGWARNREQLQRVQVRITSMDKCENVSISTVNSVCTETLFGKNDCNEEEFAGSPMVCMGRLTQSWFLAGITNWRIACVNNSIQRPRMYDKITSNLNWIRDTMSQANS